MEGVRDVGGLSHVIPQETRIITPPHLSVSDPDSVSLPLSLCLCVCVSLYVSLSLPGPFHKKLFTMKLQSLDSKAIKLALGIPVHATILGAYREADIFPLDKMRKLAAAAYIRNSIVENHTNN